MSSSSFPFSRTLLFVFFIFLSSSFSLSFPSENNVTLLGDAHYSNGAISLTQEIGSSNGVGMALYAYPIRFLDPKNNSTASFYSRFSFSINPSPSSPFGDGLAFLITSNARSLGNSSGYIGLPNHPNDTHESFIAVEFDTSFNPSLGDINDNHIGFDIDTVVSFASVDADSIGIDLKSGKRMTAWIEYRDAKKMIRVWIGYSRFKPSSPVFATQIDLSKQFRELMHVGFSASNGHGTARHLIERWQFRTFGFHPSLTPADTGQEDDCLMCLPDDLDFENGSLNPQPRRSKLGEIGLGLGGGAALLFSIVLIIGGTSWYLVKKRRLTGRGTETRQRIRGMEMKTVVPTRLSLAEIKSATRGFHRSRIIGEGASGTVYEGFLTSGREVAIKRFSRINQVDRFSDPFMNELGAMLGCLKHKNLVQLQGWCCEGNELVLVYEYMLHGSLDKLLHKTSNSPMSLNWECRLKIILGVASALIYLHEECERQIIHRDVKACNIMLDAEFNAKLGDFGLAELYERSNRTREAIIPAGTMGYLAPEYVHLGVPTEKTDVYSFGVLVLEVATGRRPVDADGIVLVDWVWDMWTEGKLMEAVDHRLMGRFDRRGMEGMLMVGLSCVRPNCMERPTVKEAARMLRGEEPLPMLPTRKPVVRLLSHLPRGAEEILRGDRNHGTPWSTPRTHFS